MRSSRVVLRLPVALLRTAAPAFADRIEKEGTPVEFAELPADRAGDLPRARAAVSGPIAEFLTMYGYKVKLGPLTDLFQ